MRKFLLILAWTCFYQSVVLAQCCPYIDSLYIQPENPQAGDSVQFVYSVATPTISFLLSRTVWMEETAIEIDVCYTATDATAISYFKDTLELGQLEAGNYELTFEAALTGDTLVCYVTDSQIRSVLFTVEAPSSFKNPAENSAFRIFPNPAFRQITLDAASPFHHLRLFNTLGQVVFERAFAPEVRSANLQLPALPEGLYWVEVWISRQKNPEILPLQIIR